MLYCKKLYRKNGGSFKAKMILKFITVTFNNISSLAKKACSREPCSKTWLAAKRHEATWLVVRGLTAKGGTQQRGLR